MIKQMLRTKPIAGVHAAHGDLKRCLTAFDLVLLGVGAIIGTGIFVLTGIAAAHQSGPAVVLSFIVSGIACTFAALAYSELASAVGGCGGAYGYCYAAFGELFAFLIGWSLLVEYGVAVAAVANGWSGYFQNALLAIGVELPKAITAGPAADGIVNLPAVCIVLALMTLLVIGVKQSARFNAALVFVKLATIAVFIAIAAFNVNPENWSPFMPFGWFDPGTEGRPVGILAGAAIVFFAYIGFDAVSAAAEEASNPARDLPIGIIGSLAACAVVYVIVSGLLTGIVNYKELGVASPVAHALQLLGINWASGLVAAGVIAGLTTVMLVMYYGLTRVIFAMARDGLFPPFFAETNPKTQTPVRVIVICGVIMAVLAGAVPLGALAELVNIGTLTAFIVVCLGVIALRRFRPDLPRPFQAPYGALFPVLGALSCFALILFLPPATWLRFGIWLAIGAAVYLLYSLDNSKLQLAVEDGKQ
jgi:APA family basic amino acid/polyamine antiporter